ncbi:MAG: pyruvate dehydrogenase complex dihydrolipoamide acetyltransferase [Anderseniella sp.]|jgi:pyruvate dehydrogenase E2 component (dihydrolipoamide acetyltransferase)|nr:pyruvate dehydrogenase complex dihydrolipoamide acetyltransferase [Anderseniella sp.]
MPTEILMPALSPTMEKGKLAKWLVKEGDSVSSGDIIAEIETDKATMEVEAVDEGTVGKILVAEGTDDVAVNTAIAVLLEEGESAGDIKSTGEEKKPAPAPKAEAKAEAAPQPKAEAPAPAAPATKAAAPAREPDSRIFASPLARRIARQNGIDIALLSGSGPHGRIVKADVEKAQKEGVPAAAPKAAAPAAAPVAAGPSDDMVRKLFAEGSYEELPHDGMRKTIAARLSESNQTVPSYNVSLDCQLDALLKVRADLNAAAPEKDGKPAYKLSVNDFIIKALALALRDVPMANGSWTSTARLLHKHSDVGVAVAIPDGLITPIVRRAEEKPLSVISAEVKDMVGRARTKKLKPEEYQGGTTAVSNLGMFGVDNFTSIINPPHASIVSIGAGVEKPVVKNGAVAIATVMNATFAFDHRVIDGALGAELASAFRHYVENPMAMLV